MTLAALPVLAAGETVVVNYDGNIIWFNGSWAVNTWSVYVWAPETDPLENTVFVDNKDKAEVKTQLPNGTTPPVINPLLPPVASSFVKTIQNYITKIIEVRDEIFHSVSEVVIPKILPNTGAWEE
jgi:hypothetical protein